MKKKQTFSVVDNTPSPDDYVTIDGVRCTRCDFTDRYGERCQFPGTVSDRGPWRCLPHHLYVNGSISEEECAKRIRSRRVELNHPACEEFEKFHKERV